MKTNLKFQDVEKNGFVKTLNCMGYMCSELDLCSQKFIAFSRTCQLPVLDIGAAYGIATIQALKTGASVISNDLDIRHLEILKEKATLEDLHNRLQLCAGSFPEELELKSRSVGAILISRVLHFFEGNTIRTSLKKCYDWLDVGGKLFLVSDLPYMKNWKDFISDYENRVAQNDEWPGYLEDSWVYAKERCQDRQRRVNFLNPDVLSRELKRAGFLVETADFIDRHDFPEDMKGLGRESAYAIGVKA